MIDSFSKLYQYSVGRKYKILTVVKFYTILFLSVRILANLILPIYCVLTKHRKSYSLKSKRNFTKEKRVIVSLTTFPARIDKLWLTLETLFRQKVKPDMIILWLSKSQFYDINSLPSRLLKMQKRGLIIKFVDNDIRSHKKYFYALSQYPDDILVLVDDDLFYPSTMLQNLLANHEQSPNKVICSYFHYLSYDINNNLLSYRDWFLKDNKKGRIFFGSGGGTLIPPGILYQDISNIKLATDLCPLADDIWLNTMCYLNNTAIVAGNNYKTILPVLNKSEKLESTNVANNYNDVQIVNVRNHYLKTIKKDPFAYDTNR